MAFLNPAAEQRGVPRAEINMIPLIDVMLVLLVIFMITAPLLTHAVKLELPRASSQPPQAAPKVELALDARGQLHWDGQPVAESELEARLQALGQQRPGTEIHLQADQSVTYDRIARLISSAAQAGLGKIAFVPQPARP